MKWRNLFGMKELETEELVFETWKEKSRQHDSSIEVRFNDIYRRLKNIDEEIKLIHSYLAQDWNPNDSVEEVDDPQSQPLSSLQQHIAEELSGFEADVEAFIESDPPAKLLAALGVILRQVRNSISFGQVDTLATKITTTVELKGEK